MKSLNFFAQFYGCLGIPNHSRMFAEALIDNGERINLTPIFQKNPGPDSEYGLTPKLRSHIGRPDKNHPALIFWYPDTYDSILGGFPKNLCYFIFEYNIIPKQFIEAINRTDGVCTASKWGTDTLKANGVTVPTYIIPGGVDGSVFNSNKRKLDKNIFRFLHVGKMESRKGTTLLIKAFNEAFKGDKSIVLDLYIDNVHIEKFNGNDFLKALSYGLKYPIDNVFIKHFTKDPATLYQNCHAFVAPTKAEGIGLPITEALSCGIPSIVSYNTGVTEYVSSETAILLEKLNEEPIYDEHFFPVAGQLGTWMAPTVGEIKEKLLWTYEHYQDAKGIGERAEAWMRANYSWDLAAKRLMEIL